MYSHRSWKGNYRSISNRLEENGFLVLGHQEHSPRKYTCGGTIYQQL
jgi:chemotaxis methyl-accepting protein methylase